MSRFAALLEDFFYRPDEDVGGLLELDVASDAPIAVVPEERSEEFLSFGLASELYAVPLRDVREIVKIPPLTDLPRVRKELLGVMNLRGEVLPVYDVRMRLNLTNAPADIAGPDAKAPSKGSRIVVLRSEAGDAGIFVESVRGVVRIKPSTIEPPPRGVVSGERDAVVGIGRLQGELVILLSAAEVLG